MCRRWENTSFFIIKETINHLQTNKQTNSKGLIIKFNLKLKTSCSTAMMNIIWTGDLKARAESTPVNQSQANGKFSTNASNWLIPSHKQRPFSSRMRSCAFFPAQNTATVGNSLHWSTWSARSDCENVWPEFWTFEDFFLDLTMFWCFRL